MKKENIFAQFDLRSYLTIVGLASIIIFGSELIFTISGGLGLERQEWIQYLLLGTLFPALAFILVFAKKKAFLPKIVAVVEFFFVFAACIFLLSIVTGNLLKSSVAEFIVAIVASLLQVCIIFFIHKNQIGFITREEIFSWSIFTVVLVAVWMACIRFITHRYSWIDNTFTIEWWFWPGWPGNFTKLVESSFIRRGGLIALVSVITTLHFISGSRIFDAIRSSFQKLRVTKQFILNVFDICFIFLFFMLCIKTNRVLNFDIQGHFDYLLSPVVSVKQGAWLLWDQPSVYGFLWVFLVAIIPIKNTFIALTLFLTVLNFLLSNLLYFIFCGYRPQSILNRIFAFLFVISSFLIRSFQNQDLSITQLNGNFTEGYSFWYWLSPVDIPQISAIRTIWCCILVIIVFKYSLANDKYFEKVSLLGCGIWAIGCLWSIESAIYSTATWIPAYIYICIFKQKFRWIFLPLLAIGMPIVLLTLYYYSQLSHFPDWAAFFEFASKYSFSGNLGVPLARTGVIWAAIFVLLSIVWLLARVTLRSFYNPLIAIYLSCFGVIWSVTSYYIGDSVNLKFLAVEHVYVLVIIILLKTLETQFNTIGQNRLRLVLINFLVFILVCGLDFDRVGLAQFYDSQFKRSYSYWDIKGYRASMPESLRNLLETSNIDPSDHIMLANSFGDLPAWPHSDGRYISDYKVWLPTNLTLPDSRARKYIERFVNRSCVGGWLITPRDFDPLLNKLSESTMEISIKKALVEDTNYFNKTKRYSNRDWVLDYYELNLERFGGCK